MQIKFGIFNHFAAILLFVFGASQTCTAQINLDIWTDTIKKNIEGMTVAIPKPYKGGRFFKNGDGRFGTVSDSNTLVMDTEYSAAALLADDYYALRKDDLWLLYLTDFQIDGKPYNDIVYLNNEETNGEPYFLIQQGSYWNVMNEQRDFIYKQGFDKIIFTKYNLNIDRIVGIRGNEAFSLYLRQGGETKINAFQAFADPSDGAYNLYNLITETKVFKTNYTDVREVSPTQFVVQNETVRFALIDLAMIKNDNQTYDTVLKFEYTDLLAWEPAIFALCDGKTWFFYANGKTPIGSLSRADVNLELFPKAILHKKANGWAVLDKFLQPIFKDVYTDVSINQETSFDDNHIDLEAKRNGKTYLLNVTAKTETVK